MGTTDYKAYDNLDPFTEGLGIDVGWVLLVAVDAKNVTLEGEGSIDGQGSALKERHIKVDTRPEGKRWGLRPFLLRLVRCEGVTVRDVTLKCLDFSLLSVPQCEDRQCDDSQFRGCTQ